MMPLDLLSRISELALKTLSNGPGLLNSPLWVFCFVLFLYFNASIFKGKWDFCLLFLYLFIYLFLSNLAYSSKPRDQSTLLSWSLSPSLMCDYWNSGGERCSSVWGPFPGSPGREQSGRRHAPLSSTGWIPKSFTLPVSANSR